FFFSLATARARASSSGLSPYSLISTHLRISSLRRRRRIAHGRKSRVLAERVTNLSTWARTATPPRRRAPRGTTTTRGGRVPGSSRSPDLDDPGGEQRIPGANVPASGGRELVAFLGVGGDEQDGSRAEPDHRPARGLVGEAGQRRGPVRADHEQLSVLGHRSKVRRHRDGGLYPATPVG